MRAGRLFFGILLACHTVVMAQSTNQTSAQSTAQLSPQPGTPPAASAACPPVTELTSEQLLGQWTVQWSGSTPADAGIGRLVFARNPEFTESLIGLLDIGTARHEIAGDIELDLLTLEESPDGKQISANWSLRPVTGRCGKEYAGQWLRAADGHERQVVLRRPASW